jgi:MATE family multidrug resistance protein
LALNLFFLYMIQIVTLLFLGHQGTEQLAAAALAMAAVNTLGTLLFIGLCGATDTLAAQVCPCGSNPAAVLCCRISLQVVWRRDHMRTKEDAE